MLGAALQLARKDLLLFVRDRTAVLLTFLLPVVLGTIFGTAMTGMAGGGGGGGGAPKVELAVEDRDGSEASRALVEALRAADGLQVTVVGDARRLVANGDQPCGLVVPAGYGAGAAAGAPPDLALLRDPSRTISQQVVLFQLAPVLLAERASALGAGMMDRALELFELPEAARGPAGEALRESYERMDAVMAELAASGALAPAADAPDPAGVPATSPGFDPLESLPGFLGLAAEDVAGVDEAGLARSWGASHAFSSMAVMMLLFSVVGAGGTLLQERADGTLVRLQLTPAAGRAVLLGKLLSCGVIALAQIVVLFLYGAALFDVPTFASPGLLALVSVVWVFLALGIGLVFSVACSSQKQLEGLSTLVILVMSAVGGAWFPREITPEWFRTVGSITPVAWTMDAYHGVLWYGKGILPAGDRDGLWPQLLTMATTAVVLLALAFRLYRRRFAAGG